MKRDDFDSMVLECKTNFSRLKDDYKILFCDLYGFDTFDSYWRGNVLEVADYFVGLYDVMYAVDNEITDDQFFTWYDYSLTLVEYSLGDISLENFINNIIKYSVSDINKLRELQNKLSKSKNELDDFLNFLRNGNQNN